MKNPKFLTIEFAPNSGKFTNLQLIPNIAELLYNNRFQLFDAFFDINNKNKIEKTIELIQHTSPAFWAIVDPKSGELAGIAYLYDWIGSEQMCYSTKVSTCFARRFWGDFAHRAGKLFTRYIFAKYRPQRICAEVYKQNAYPKRLLTKLGFKYEFTKPAATISNAHAVDVLGYALKNPKSAV